MKLKHVNNILLVLIIIISGYTALAPFWPSISYEGQSEERKALENKITGDQPIGGDNRLIAPAMGLEAPILEAREDWPHPALNNGIWHKPKSSSPDKGGNTVLTGHRFVYNNPNGVFYHLDKLKVGDNLAVVWDQQKYLYKVRAVKVVKPSQASVEAPTKNNQLTLYTCTPLWVPKDRLVVIANLEES